MSKARLNVNIDKELYEEFKKVADQLGLTINETITIFVKDFVKGTAQKDRILKKKGE